MTITQLIVIAVIIYLISKNTAKKKSVEENTGEETVEETETSSDVPAIGGLTKILVAIVTVVSKIVLAIFNLIVKVPIIKTIATEVRKNLEEKPHE